MSEIPRLLYLDSISEDQRCQEASPMSGHRYFACGAKAVAIIDNGDTRPYAMCLPCAMHNLRNRGASIIYTTDKTLQGMMDRREVKVKKLIRPRFIENSTEGTEDITSDDLPGKGD